MDKCQRQKDKIVIQQSQGPRIKKMILNSDELLLKIH